MVINSLSLSSGDINVLEIDNHNYLNTSVNIKDLQNIIENNWYVPRFRIFVLYHDETVSYEIPQDDIVVGGSYSENYQNGQRRSLSFSLYNDDGKYNPNINIFWAGTRLRLDVGLELNSGDVIWVKKGVFVIDQINPIQQSGNNLVQISANDKFGLFENKTGTLEDTYEIPEGSEIEQIISGILLSDMGNGQSFDTRKFIYHSSFKGKKTQVIISKSAGETFGSILLELATQLSAEIFYNSEGMLNIIPTDEVSLDNNKPLLYHYDIEEGDVDSLGFNFNMNEIVNRVIVIGVSKTGGVCKAIAVNDDVSSPLCYQRIGYRTGSIINDSNITTNYLAEERAAYELRRTLIMQSATNINVNINPLLSVNNLISLTGEFFELKQERFLIQGISFSLDYSNIMSISLSNIKNLPGIM